MSNTEGTCLWRSLAGCLWLALSSAALPARAQDARAAAEEAHTLFKDARELMKSGNYAAACPKLARSQELDPGMGTQYRLAECYQGLGRLATAWKLYLDVAAAAKKAGRTDRERYARQRADELLPRLPMLKIRIATDLTSIAGLEVTRDGHGVRQSDWNQKLSVDPGEHTIAVMAPGKKRFTQTVQAVERGAVEVIVAALENDAPASVPTTSAGSPAGRSSSWGAQKVAAIAAGVAGLAGIGIGTGFGIAAINQWNEAKSHCKNPFKGTNCDSAGVMLGYQANDSATISTIGFAGGGAALVGAVLLWTLARNNSPRAAIGVFPSAGADGVGAVVHGRF